MSNTFVLGSQLILQNQGLSKSEDGSGFIDKNKKFEIKSIKISEVNNKLTYAWYIKKELDEDIALINNLIAKIKAGIKLHPIVLNKDMKILDGNHRFIAYRKLNYKQIDVYIECN